jgi:hypothetical protein
MQIFLVVCFWFDNFVSLYILTYPVFPVSLNKNKVQKSWFVYLNADAFTVFIKIMMNRYTK